MICDPLRQTQYLKVEKAYFIFAVSKCWIKPNKLYRMPRFTSFVVESHITKALSFRMLYDITIQILHVSCVYLCGVYGNGGIINFESGGLRLRTLTHFSGHFSQKSISTHAYSGILLQIWFDKWFFVCFVLFFIYLFCLFVFVLFLFFFFKENLTYV